MDPHPCLSASLCCAEFETISNFAASYPFPMAKIQDRWILRGQDGNCPSPSSPDFGRIRIKICSIIRLYITEAISSLIWMTHWRHTWVDGAKFLISCHWLKLLSKASRWQPIQNLMPSIIVGCQCDTWIPVSVFWDVSHLLLQWTRNILMSRKKEALLA